ncbi:MAG: hypothetical protein LBR38_08860 [Synergistaceae bacterium]|jgi:hypothetical protein|nr:hypothetical protein [Synergistaceae bacterium]
MTSSQKHQAARALGAYWEEAFARLAIEAGFSLTLHQSGRRGAARLLVPAEGGYRGMPLPDVTIWTSPVSHHEIKHKNPTDGGNYGLEVYRFNALTRLYKETGERVMYTIHDWTRLGRDNRQCEIEDWVTASVRYLATCIKKTKDGYSYVDGQWEIVPIHLWPKDVFRPLTGFWRHVRSGGAS